MSLTRAGLPRVLRNAARGVRDLGLDLEQAIGVLGPAHRTWRGNSVADNYERWSRWDWSSLGEEWTASEEWKQGLVNEVLLAKMPSRGTVLEIGPGGGRWSVILAERADRLLLVDVSPRVLEVARGRLGDAPHVRYMCTAGTDFPDVEDTTVDAIWSFDVFVHVAPLEQARYLDEMARVLSPGGVALIHHADGRNRGLLPSQAGWRSPMSARLFARLAQKRGFRVEEQLRSWSGGRHDLSAYGDVISVLRR
jgi:ubiquinone/menaquinone biosynthesis C-methylase UbiE